VLEKLERLPPEALTAQRGTDFVGVIDSIAKRQLLLREFDRARASYERALAIHDGLEGLAPRMVALGRASLLHGLGIVAQLQDRFDEAEDAYKKALAIYLEFNDRHSAANTYHQLGMVTEEQSFSRRRSAAGHRSDRLRRQHAITYLRPLDAEAEGADWTEVAWIVLHIDPAEEPARARKAWDSHRAKWLVVSVAAFFDGPLSKDFDGLPTSASRAL
jgi:tetratricopeptide (TPR) repeat protein